MKLVVWKKHLKGAKFWYRNPNPAKNRVFRFLEKDGREFFCAQFFPPKFVARPVFSPKICRPSRFPPKFVAPLFFVKFIIKFLHFAISVMRCKIHFFSKLVRCWIWILFINRNSFCNILETANWEWKNCRYAAFRVVLFFVRYRTDKVWQLNKNILLMKYFTFMGWWT